MLVTNVTVASCDRYEGTTEITCDETNEHCHFKFGDEWVTILGDMSISDLIEALSDEE